MKKLAIGLMTLALGVCTVPQPTQAQLLLVTGNYRVTELDQEHERIGVALPEASPKETQNWIYVSPSIKVDQRQTNRQGWHKDQKLSYMQLFEQAKPGTMLRVHGGRRWDGAITAKHIWIGYVDKNGNLQNMEE